MKKNKILTAAGIILGLLCIICAAFALFLQKEPDTPTVAAPTQIIFPSTKETENKEIYKSPIDFEEIHKEAPDVFSWLSIDGTDINYPVVFREGDNSYYLRRNIYGKYDRKGSLFIEDYNKPDFNDPVTIIYGHHLSSGEMFGKLQEIYTNPETFNKNNKIMVYTPEKMLTYRVFCAVPLDNSHILYYHNFNNALVFEKYFSDIRETRSLMTVFDEDIIINHGDRVLMLSTCFENDYSRRYVVMAVCEEEKF
ncbi:MAG: class B sortase [Clostridia bacterium]|nr:class B sortase [Clostridia bacterium]